MSDLCGLTFFLLRSIYFMIHVINNTVCCFWFCFCWKFFEDFQFFLYKFLFVIYLSMYSVYNCCSFFGRVVINDDRVKFSEKKTRKIRFILSFNVRIHRHIHSSSSQDNSLLDKMMKTNKYSWTSFIYWFEIMMKVFSDVFFQPVHRSVCMFCCWSWPPQNTLDIFDEYFI